MAPVFSVLPIHMLQVARRALPPAMFNTHAQATAAYVRPPLPRVVIRAPALSSLSSVHATQASLALIALSMILSLSLSPSIFMDVIYMYMYVCICT